MSEPSPSEVPDPGEWLGRTLDERYRIEAPLGAGGLGQVFRATHLGLERPVAVKVLHEELLSNEALRQRFQREVAMLSRFAHPHVVTLLDSGVVDDGVGYLVMELLEGESLEQRLEGGPLAPDEAIAVARQILLGLAEAHAKGILHRDIKPANVFLQPLAAGGTHVKLLDFGLAKVRGDMAAELGAQATLTADGTIVGTPTYMAPEQAAGATVDTSSDVYAVGVVLFEMLTGRPPFQGANQLETIRAHLRDPVPELDAVRPRLRPTAALRALAHSALAKGRLERFASAKEMLGALDELPEPPATLAEGDDAPARAISGTEDTIAVGSSELEAVTPPAEVRRSPEAETVASMPAAGAGEVGRDAGRAARPAARASRVAPLVVGVALAAAAGAVWWLWPDGPPPGGAGATEAGETAAGEGAVGEGAEPDGASTPPAPEEGVAVEEEGPDNPFRDAPLPEELRTARGRILRGRWLSDAQARQVARYQRAHRSDPRPSLLLARHHRLQGHWARMVRHYRSAHRIDPEVTGFSPMLPDLVRAAREGASARAAIRVVVDVYGRDALPEVEEALGDRLGARERRRLRRLRRRLEALPPSAD